MKKSITTIIFALLIAFVFAGIEEQPTNEEIVKIVNDFYKKKNSKETGPNYEDLSIIVKKTEKTKSSVEKYHVEVKVTGYIKPKPDGPANSMNSNPGQRYEEDDFEEFLIFKVLKDEKGNWVTEGLDD
jgi:hypothetical protein